MTSTELPLLGKTILEINVLNHNYDDSIEFICSDGSIFNMHHEQDCCESVTIEDIDGDIDDLIGSPITMAEEVVKDDENASESGTWTFYKFATIKGYVTIRWYGASNGYYSESVTISERHDIKRARSIKLDKINGGS